MIQESEFSKDIIEGAKEVGERIKNESKQSSPIGVEQAAKEFSEKEWPILSEEDYYKRGNDEPYYDYSATSQVIQFAIKKGFIAGSQWASPRWVKASERVPDNSHSCHWRQSKDKYPISSPLAVRMMANNAKHEVEWLDETPAHERRFTIQDMIEAANYYTSHDKGDMVDYFKRRFNVDITQIKGHPTAVNGDEENVSRIEMLEDAFDHLRKIVDEKDKEINRLKVDWFPIIISSVGVEIMAFEKETKKITEEDGNTLTHLITERILKKINETKFT